MSAMDGPNRWPQSEANFPLQSEASKLHATGQVLGNVVIDHVQVSLKPDQDITQFEWQDKTHFNWLQVSGKPEEVGGKWSIQHDVSMKNHGELRVVASNAYVAQGDEHIAPTAWLPEHTALLTTLSRLNGKLALKAAAEAPSSGRLHNLTKLVLRGLRQLKR
jgi:hypothetical protein